MKNTKKIISLVLSLVLCVAALSSCASDNTPSTGVGRDTETKAPSVQAGADVAPDGSDTENAGTAPDESESEGSDESESADVSEGETDEPEASGDLVADSYNVPTDLSFLNSIQKGHFSDKNKDDPKGCWFPGKVTRDLATGEVTYNWDRAQDTLNLIDKYGAIYRGNDEKKYVYLTFDCGYEYRTEEGKYSVGVTNIILDVLKEKNAPGTFFVTGDYLKTDSDIVERMLDEGHIVGTHTMHHYNMTTITPEKFVEEIKLNNDLLKEKIPTAPDMTFYRPPEGGANEWTLALAAKMGLTTSFWSATIVDYKTDAQPDPAAALEADKTMLHNGCVYLLHAVSITNAEILGDLIDYIRAEGYEILPLDEFVR